MTASIGFDIFATDRASRTFDKVGGSAERAAGRTAKFQSSMSKLGITFGAGALVGGIAKTINLAKDFDLTMRQVGVQTDSSGAKLKSLSALAMKMGADTAFSSKDASQAMLELAKGGLSAAQIKAGALNTTMTLAAAGNLDMASSAGYVTQAMNTFGLSARQANQVAIALAGGANASTASVESLGMALSQVGPGAKNAGMSLQETVAALSAFDNAGIKGSDAGTSLKTMLSRLVPQTDRARDAMSKYHLSFVNANGSFKSMSQVAQQLKTHLGGLTEAEKTSALTTIFGSDATRAATVLMNNGAKGIDRYVAATKNQNTVQKMANTAMDGASGAWNQFTGSLETAGIQLGMKLLPAFTKASSMGADFVNEAMTWGPKISDAFGPTVKIGTDLVKAFAPAGRVLLDLVGWLGNLPGPVHSLAVQAAIAAVVFPRLSLAVRGAGASMMTAGLQAQSYGLKLMSANTRAATMRATLSRIGPAARGAAGMGGLMLLSKSSGKASAEMQALGKVGGGALLGFSVGGPVGAAVGALGGALWVLNDALHDTSGGMEAQKVKLSGYRAALDATTLAITKQGRALVAKDLIENGAMRTAAKLGISSRDLISATLGQEKAIERVRRALQRATNPNKKGGLAEALGSKGSMKDAQKVMDAIGVKLDDTRAKMAAAQQKAVEYRASLTDLPPNVKTAVQALGTQASAKDVARLRDQYHLTPKQVRTVLKVLGGKATEDQVNRVKKTLQDTGKVKPDLGNWQNRLAGGVAKGAEDAAAGTGRVNKNLRKAGGVNPQVGAWRAYLTRGVQLGVGDARAGYGGVNNSLRKAGNVRANTQPWTGSVAAAVANARRSAAGSYGVGLVLKSGIIAGFAGTAGALASMAAGAVRNAIGAAKAAAGAHSPSRKMMALGRDMAMGAVIGMDSQSRQVEAAGARVSKKAHAAAVKKAKELAKQRAQRKSEFALGFSSFGSSIFGTDTSETGTSVGAILADQANKLKAAQQLKADMSAVAGKGLSKALIRQLAEAGPGGVAQLHALAGGSAAQIAQLNSLNSATSSAIGSAGATAAGAVFGGKRPAAAQRAGDTYNITVNGALDRNGVAKEVITAIKGYNRTRGLKTAGI